MSYRVTKSDRSLVGERLSSSLRQVETKYVFGRCHGTFKTNAGIATNWEV